MDFVNNLDTDMSLAILSCLDDPSDLVRASAVSRSWRGFVIKHSLCKNMCLKLFPHQLTSVDRIIETSSLMEEDTTTREHRVYALLAKGCTSSPIKSCIEDAIMASSTDRLPEESILNTLDERERVQDTTRLVCPKHLFTSSRVTCASLLNSAFTLSKIYLIPVDRSTLHIMFVSGWATIHIHRIKTSMYGLTLHNSFPCLRLQKFKLQEPVLCIGGYMLVEFLDRVQRCDIDGLYYICVTHVKAMGRSLAKSFRVVDPDASGKFGLKVLSYSDPQEMEEEAVQTRHPTDVEYLWVWDDPYDEEYVEAD